jgi:mono/diheme cytochrome c family protein
MKKVLKWIGIVVGGLLVVALLVVGGMILSVNSRLNKTYSPQAEPLAIPTDEAALAIGRHYAEIHCQACHGPDLGGGPFFEDPSIGVVDAPNLTTGQGSVTAAYTDADWVLALRHGVRHDGKSVFIMPSNDFYFLSDADLGGVIAYMKTVPPVDREIRPRSLTAMAKILYAAGAFGDLLYAETIPHTVRPAVPPVGVTAEYGDYLANAHGCRSCHGQALSGQASAEPGAPPAPNLTMGGELGGWTEADFAATLRTGVTPTGYELSEFMPWKGLGKLTDDEISALWLFLQNQPALASTVQ